MFTNVLASIGGTALSYLGAREQNQMQQDQANTNTKKDYDFARNQLQWRVADAKKAGLHPLAGLGASPMSASASTIGTENALGHLGQGVSSVLNSVANKKMNELQLEAAQEDVTNKKLINQRLASEMALVKQPGTPPTSVGFMPGGSQGIPGGRIEEKPLSRTTSHRDASWSEPGALTGGGFEATPTGLAPVPSGDIKERLEDSPYELRHFWKYGVLPNLGKTETAPPPAALPNWATHWEWSITSQEWQPRAGRTTKTHLNKREAQEMLDNASRAVRGYKKRGGY